MDAASILHSRHGVARHAGFGKMSESLLYASHVMIFASTAAMICMGLSASTVTANSAGDQLRTVGWGTWNWDCAMDSRPAERRSESVGNFCQSSNGNQTCCFGPLELLERRLEETYDKVIADEKKVRGLFGSARCQNFIKQLLCAVCKPQSESYMRVKITMQGHVHATVRYCNEFCYQFAEECHDAQDYVCGRHNQKCAWKACEMFLETIRLRFPAFIWPGDGMTFKESGSRCFLADVSTDDLHDFLDEAGEDFGRTQGVIHVSGSTYSISMNAAWLATLGLILLVCCAQVQEY